MDSSASTPKALKRTQIRQRRRSISTEGQKAAGRGALEIFIKNVNLRDFATVGGYVANDGELDPRQLLAEFRLAGADILLPQTGPEHSLALAPDGELLPSGPGGILEPTGPATDLDTIRQPAILLVPSVGLTVQGGRLGRGGGFYDRVLPRLRVHGWRICGLCHDADLTEELPLESHDQPVDWCLTDKRLIRREITE